MHCPFRWGESWEVGEMGDSLRALLPDFFDAGWAWTKDLHL